MCMPVCANVWRMAAWHIHSEPAWSAHTLNHQYLHSNSLINPIKYARAVPAWFMNSCLLRTSFANTLQLGSPTSAAVEILKYTRLSWLAQWLIIHDIINAQPAIDWWAICSQHLCRSSPLPWGARQGGSAWQNLRLVATTPSVQRWNGSATKTARWFQPLNMLGENQTCLKPPTRKQPKLLA